MEMVGGSWEEGVGGDGRGRTRLPVTLRGVAVRCSSPAPMSLHSVHLRLSFQVRATHPHCRPLFHSRSLDRSL